MITIYLDKEEERMYSGEYGWPIEKAIRVIVKVGEAIGAERLIDITHAHISGVGYANIGNPGLSLLRDLVRSGAKMKVYTTANPGSVDSESYRYFQYGYEFRDKQEEIFDLYRMMGVYAFTCTPYYLRKPSRGEYLSWAETNAVLIANSLYGAKTNREGGLLALMSGIVGKTYYGGLLIDSNRIPEVLISIEARLDKLSEYGALGLITGEITGSRIPYVKGFSKGLSHERIKTFMAALGSSGSTGLALIDGISPEALSLDLDKFNLEKIYIDGKEIRSMIEKSMCEDPEAYLIGCPHASLELLTDLANMISEKSGRAKKPVWVFTSDYVYSEISRSGTLDKLEKRGINVFKGICGVISPLNMLGYRCIGTPSAKASFYLPKLAKTRFILIDLESIISDVFR